MAPLIICWLPTRLWGSVSLPPLSNCSKVLVLNDFKIRLCNLPNTLQAPTNQVVNGGAAIGKSWQWELEVTRLPNTHSHICQSAGTRRNQAAGEAWHRSTCSGSPFLPLWYFLGDKSYPEHTSFHILSGKTFLLGNVCSYQLNVKNMYFPPFDLRIMRSLIPTLQISKSFLHLSSLTHKVSKTPSVISTSSVPLCNTEFLHEIPQCLTKYAFPSNYTRLSKHGWWTISYSYIVFHLWLQICLDKTYWVLFVIHT